jgi:hypothetical protein
MQLTQAGPAHRNGRTIVSSFAAAMILAAAIPLTASNAEAASEGKVKTLSFELNPNAGLVNEQIHVVSEDKLHKKWTNFKAETWIPLDGKVQLDMKRGGKIREFGIYLGTCGRGQHPHSCFERGHSKQKQIMYEESVGGANSINRLVHFQLETSRLTQAGLGDAIIAQCNAALSDNKDIITTGHSFTATVAFTVGFDTFIGSGKHHLDEADFGDGPQPIQDIDKSRTIDVGIPVVCDPAPTTIEALPEIVDAALGVTTSGNTCPKPSTARVIMTAEAPRDVYYKIERGDGTSTTADWIHGNIKIQTDLMGGQSPWLHAEHDLGKLDPGTSKFRLVIQGRGETPWQTINVDCPPFEVISTWLKYDVEAKAICPKKVVETATFHTTRPGDVPYEIKHEGGLVVSQGTVEAKRQGDQYVATAVRNLTIGEFDGRFMADVKNSPANSGWERLKIDCLEALSGKVTLKNVGAAACKGEALVAMYTNGAGELPYELECGPGKSWQRNVKAMSNKIGVDKVQFDVTNNEQVTCVLRTRIGGKLKPLNGASMTFQCVKTTGLDGSNDLAPKTRPDPEKPHKPGKVVIDPPRKPVVIDPPRKPEASNPDKGTVSEPKISCTNGTVKNGTCSCARTDRKVKAGKSAWRCVKVVVDPPRKREGAKVGVKTAPKKTAVPKPAITSKGKRYKGRRETAKKANVSTVAH